MFAHVPFPSTEYFLRINVLGEFWHAHKFKVLLSRKYFTLSLYYTIHVDLRYKITSKKFIVSLTINKNFPANSSRKFLVMQFLFVYCYYNISYSIVLTM